MPSVRAEAPLAGHEKRNLQSQIYRDTDCRWIRVLCCFDRSIGCLRSGMQFETSSPDGQFVIVTLLSGIGSTFNGAFRCSSQRYLSFKEGGFMLIMLHASAAIVYISLQVSVNFLSFAAITWLSQLEASLLRTYPNAPACRRANCVSLVRGEA